MACDQGGQAEVPVAGPAGDASAAVAVVVGAVVGIVAEVGIPVTVVESVPVRQLKGTRVQPLRVRESRQPSAVLDETVGVQREAADAGIPTKTEKTLVLICLTLRFTFSFVAVCRVKNVSVWFLTTFDSHRAHASYHDLMSRVSLGSSKSVTKGRWRAQLSKREMKHVNSRGFRGSSCTP